MKSVCTVETPAHGRNNEKKGSMIFLISFVHRPKTKFVCTKIMSNKIKLLLSLFFINSGTISAQFVKIDVETNPNPPMEYFNKWGKKTHELIDDNTVIIGGEGIKNKVFTLLSFDIKTGKTILLTEGIKNKSGENEKKIKNGNYRTNITFTGLDDYGAPLFWVAFNSYKEKSDNFLRLYSYRNDEFKLLKTIDGYNINSFDKPQLSPNKKFIGWAYKYESNNTVHILNKETFEHKSFNIPIENNKLNYVKVIDFALTDLGEGVLLVQVRDQKSYKSVFYCFWGNPFESNDLEVKAMNYIGVNSVDKQSVNINRDGQKLITSITRRAEDNKYFAQFFFEDNETDKMMQPVIHELRTFGETDYIINFNISDPIPFGKDNLVQLISYSSGSFDEVRWYEVVLIKKNGDVSSIFKKRRRNNKDIFLHNYENNLYIFGSFLENDNAVSSKAFASIPFSSYKLMCYRFNSPEEFDTYTFDKSVGAYIINGYAKDSRVLLKVYDESGRFKGEGSSPNEGYLFLNLD